ncbi:carbohydrate-binding domain-containing protein [Eubacterium sp. 1001713B170207_170306_E7]|uniref:carbohydrate-binding domain-containing protein n=1 Tax=Eubacterium sp. 1001713B170207_170306_E7 TaxID=2787097 RepID=UPI001897072F|nr:carbohydrate-binding domain-containing protein [Eubacterium sp. 1001713B170207_170306_E7]
MKKTSFLLLAFIPLFIALLLFTAGCSAAKTDSASATGSTPSTGYDAEDYDTDYSDENPQSVTLNGSTIDFSGDGATVNGSTLTITGAGAYVLSGTLNDGSIIVDADKNATVRLVLKDANITSGTGAAIYSKQAGKTLITLESGTQNSLSDGAARDAADTEAPTAALYVQDDLTINGDGALSVTGNYNDAITSKDDLKIMSGSITIPSSVDDGIVGRDATKIAGGTLNISATGDGIKATNDQDAAKGTIQIDGGTIDITAGADAVQAETTLTVNGGSFKLNTGGGSANSSDKAGTAGNTWGNWQQAPQTAADDTSDATQSAKALKAGSAITISGGTFDIDSSDDSIHSNGTIDIKDGTFNLSSGDDGIHADTALTIDGGTFDIAKCYEGLESMSITLNGGKGSIVASDDGINAAGGDGSSQNGRPGQNPMETASVDDGSIVLNINGGDWAINAGGDGLDSNASINQTGGTVTIDGPTDSGNGALDYDGTYNLTGGTLIAAGSSGMLQTPSTSSSQNSISLTFTSSQAAGTAISLKNDSGQEIASYTPSKAFQNIIISTPDIQTGTTYTLTKGGADLTTVTSSSSVTSIGEDGSTYSGGMDGGPGNMGGPGGTQPGGSAPQDMQGGQPPQGGPGN